MIIVNPTLMIQMSMCFFLNSIINFKSILQGRLFMNCYGVKEEIGPCPKNFTLFFVGF